MFMKKMHSKFVFVVFLSVVFVLSSGPVSAAPFFESVKKTAEDRVEALEARQADIAEHKEEIKDRITEQFCERFGDTFTKMAERMERAENKLRERHENRKGDWEARFNDRDGKLGELRTEQDARREEWYGKLDDLAETDEQQEAVDTFREAVDAAVDTRREAVDAARDTFRDGIEELSNGREDDFSGLAARYRERVETAVRVAEDACEEGEDMAEIREAFRNALRTAHDEMIEGRKEANGLGEEISKLAGIRNESIRVAMNEFQDALDDAKDTLREAFPEEEDE